MADHELTPEEGFRRLDEIFGSEGASRPPTRTHRMSLSTETANPFSDLLRCRACLRFPVTSSMSFLMR